MGWTHSKDSTAIDGHSQQEFGIPELEKEGQEDRLKLQWRKSEHYADEKSPIATHFNQFRPSASLFIKNNPGSVVRSISRSFINMSATAPTPCRTKPTTFKTIRSEIHVNHTKECARISKLARVDSVRLYSYPCQLGFKVIEQQKNLLRVCQRKMESKVLQLRLQDRIRNTDIRIRSCMQDAVRLALRLKWEWGGHVSRMDCSRWTYASTMWDPRIGKRSRRRPRRETGAQWTRTARDRQAWKRLEEITNTM
ncbi:hypothetical protein ANN_24461 [Periplaneta americana]|uniref:Uncharacterized protein n=1 Tax=Periplaneta americana TaxID=6978 RepID=A0ABQ8S338_PERAM|nr:hypothetical protein ANN_24461 [Periplaneta americana]